MILRSLLIVATPYLKSHATKSLHQAYLYEYAHVFNTIQKCARAQSCYIEHFCMNMYTYSTQHKNTRAQRMRTRTHARLHACTHAHTHRHRHTRVVFITLCSGSGFVHLDVQHIYAHKHTYTYTHTHIHVVLATVCSSSGVVLLDVQHINAHKHTHIHTQTHKYTHTHTFM